MEAVNSSETSVIIYQSDRTIQYPRRHLLVAVEIWNSPSSD
jgi:hypothetical protein